MPVQDDALGWLQQLYMFLRDGAHFPAIGAALVLLVWLARQGASKLPPPVGPWFLTTLGGYVLGYTSAALLYFGTALASGQAITLALVGSAIGAAWAASGGWEKLRDVLNWIRTNPPKQATIGGDGGGAVDPGGDKRVNTPGGGTTITKLEITSDDPDRFAAHVIECFRAPTLGVLALLILVACSDCHTQPVQAVIDCTKADQQKIASLVTDMSPLVVGERPDWAAIEAKAEGAGIEIGGCVLAMMVQSWLSRPKATPVDQSWIAHDALERFRTRKANGATFHTAQGDL